MNKSATRGKKRFLFQLPGRQARLASASPQGQPTSSPVATLTQAGNTAVGQRLPAGDCGTPQQLLSSAVHELPAGVDGCPGYAAVTTGALCTVQGRMKLEGAVFHPKSKFLALQYNKRRGKTPNTSTLSARGTFDSVVVFSRYYWVQHQAAALRHHRCRLHSPPPPPLTQLRSGRRRTTRRRKSCPCRRICFARCLH